jgi:hypothetical protein
MNCVGHQSPGLWAHPLGQSWKYKDLDYWQNLARTLETGIFDGIFIADVIGYYDVYKGSLRLTEKDLAEILGSLVYHDHPIGPALVDQIRITAEDLKLVKVLELTTDPKAFAERVTVNLLA